MGVGTEVARRLLCRWRKGRESQASKGLASGS